MRAKLDECFPRLQYVASQSFGSVVGKETSEDGLGYGPMFQVTRYAFSTAFLVTEGFKDQDSLAARMIQARFTGHYRFACRAWYEWVNDARESTAKIVMEYCERGSVVDDERDTFERFDLSDVKAIARDVLRALRTCHARNIAHYDVKPQNIFASASGAYKLGDFGCATRVKPIAVGSRREAKARAKAKANAKTNANASELERTHEFVGKTPGTPAFTAPECCEGEPCDGFKADVWALGMTLHALATGRYFYQADGAWDTYQKVLRESVDLGEIARLGDDGFTDFMTRVLERDPNERLTARQALKHPWITPERRDDDAGAREKSRKKSIWRRLFSRRGRRRCAKPTLSPES